jgi:hypothetical protein
VFGYVLPRLSSSCCFAKTRIGCVEASTKQNDLFCLKMNSLYQGRGVIAFCLQ